MRKYILTLALVMCIVTVPMLAQIVNPPTGSVTSIAGLTQGWGLTVTSSGQLVSSPFQLDALSFDPTPASPSTVCPDMVTAEITGVNGNFAVPTNALGLSTGTKILCNTNPLATAKDGSVFYPSALLQSKYSHVLISQTVANGGPTNVYGSGHSGTCGQNGACATWLEGEIGMALAQMGQVSISAANPAVVTLTGPSSQTMGNPANTAWVGLSFITISPTTGTITQQNITGVTCTTPANSYPCATTDTLTLTGSWTGTTGPGQNYFIGFPGTVQVSNANPPVVTGTGTAFNAAWVGTTFNAGGLSATGGLCGGAACTIASVTNGTSMTLSGTSWSGSVASGLSYTLGTVYGPVFTFGQASLPVTQGNSVSNLTVSGSGGGTSMGPSPNGNSCLYSYFGQEQTWLTHLKIQDCGAVFVDIGGGGFYSQSANSGPFDEGEVVAGGVLPTQLNPIATTVSSISGTALVGSGLAYPVQAAYSIVTTSTAPVPAPARGNIVVLSGVAAGTAGTVYNGNWRVIDQITPTSFLIFNATSHASDSSTGGGTATIYPLPISLTGHPFYAGRGLHDWTVNMSNFTYTSNKPAYDGAAATTQLPVGIEFGGGIASGSGRLFVQNTDNGCVFGELGPIRGGTFYDLGCGGGLTGSNAVIISSQFPVGPATFVSNCGTSGQATQSTNTLIDNPMSNTYPMGTNFNGNPCIGLYAKDLNGFPVTNALIAVAGAPTVNNGLHLNGTDGIAYYKGGTSPLLQFANTGLATVYGGIAQTGQGLTSTPASTAAGGVTIGSGTSIATTSLCSTALCPAGLYSVHAYLDVTTACTTTGTYIVWLSWTDGSSARVGSSTTTFIPINGVGATSSTGTLALSAVGNFGEGTYDLVTTGAANQALGSINYGTTATACGTGGPMVGKLFLVVTRIG